MYVLTDAYTTCMDIAANERCTKMFLESQFLNTLHEPVTLTFVRHSTPMVVEIIQKFNLAIKFVGEAR